MCVCKCGWVGVNGTNGEEDGVWVGIRQTCVRGVCVIFTCVHVRVGGECGKEVWWCVSGVHVQKK